MAGAPDREIELSVVIPVFGCASCLERLFERLAAVLETLRLHHEVVFVDDGTEDGSRDILARIADDHPGVVVHRLARNAGQHAAILAGLSRTGGRRVVVMDCDLQHPPESIPEFLEASRRGHDIVLGTRAAPHRSAARRLASRAFRSTVGAFRRFPNDADYGAFSLLSRRAVRHYLGHPAAGRGYLVVLDRLDLPFALVGYTHAERYAGNSAYTVPKLVRHALNSSWNSHPRFVAVLIALLALSGIAVLWLVLATYPG